MIFDRINGTATITSGAAATATAITFTLADSPSKVVRLMASVPSFAANASAGVYVFQGTEVLYAGAMQITAGVINTPVDIDVFPGDTVKVVTTATIGNGANTVAISAHLEK